METTQKTSGRADLKLQYSMEIGSDGLPDSKLDPSSWEAYFGQLGPMNIVVYLTKNRLAIDWLGEKRLSVSYDLRTEEALIIDHARHEYRRIPRAVYRRVVGDFQNKTEWRLERMKKRHQQQLGKLDLLLEHFTVRGPLLCNITVARNSPAFPAASQQLWKLMLPFLEHDVCRAGLPYEIALRSPDLPASSYALVRLTALEIADAASVPPHLPPEGYSEIKPVEIHQKLSRRKIDRGFQGPLDTNARDMRRRHQLRTGGQDVAWAPRQSFLDVVSDAVNSIASTFNTFQGRGDRLNAIIIDWQQQLADHLDDDRRLALQLLNLYGRVYEGKPLVSSADHASGLTPDERTAVQSAEPSEFCRTWNLDDKACQVVTFIETMLGLSDITRINELAQAQWDQLEIVLDTRSEAVREANDCFQFRAWDFDAEIVINGEPIIDSLTFRDDEIRLVLHLDEVYVDFQWSSGPNPDGVCSMLCTFLTFGICALIETNYSPWSYLVVEDARIVIDFRPEIDGDQLRLEPHLNHDETDYDIDIFLRGFNLLQDVILLAVSAIGSWFEFFDNRLFRELQARLDDLFSYEFLVWPGYWHVDRGPGIRPTVALFSSEPAGGSFEASVRQTSGLPRAIAEDVDLERLPASAAFAFVVSRRYLTAWFRHLINLPHIASLINIAVGEIETAVGITLPEPSQLPGADAPMEFVDPFRPPFLGCDDPPPPGPPTEYMNRAILRRSAPTVDLPEEGQREVAGLVTVEYEFIVEAIRRDFDPTLHIVREPCIQDPGAFFGGFGQFVGFPGPFIHPDWLRGEPTLIDRQPGTQPGITPELRPSISGLLIELLGSASGDLPELNVLRFGQSPVPGNDTPGEPGSFPCPPPFCEWTFRARETTLLTYVSARVIATADVLVGFSGNELWLPELILRIPEEGYTIEIESLTMEDPFSSDVQLTLENYLVDKVRTDLSAYLEPAEGNPPDNRHVMVPEDALWLLGTYHGTPEEIQQEIRDWVVFQQAGDNNRLEYTVTESLVYWPIVLEEGLTAFLSP
jgi:hypothetical protein